MLYPFMSVYREDEDEEGREMVNPPSKSLCCNAILQEANLEMESYFETIFNKTLIHYHLRITLCFKIQDYSNEKFFEIP